MRDAAHFEEQSAGGHSHTRRRAPAAESGLERLLLRTVDLSLAGILIVVPFILGGNTAVGRFALMLLALCMTVSWCLRQCLQPRARWFPSGVEWLVVAAIAVVSFQLLPLPSGIVSSISPKIAETLPLWSAGESAASLGEWSRLSLTPSSTLQGLLILLAYAMVFVVTLQRVRELEDVERVLWWVAVSAAAMGAFGVVQYLAGNGKFFWFYDYPYTDTVGFAKGGFTNRNHFAHLLALGIGPTLWCLMRTLASRSSTDRFSMSNGDSSRELWVGIAILLLGIVLFGGLLSMSRGGALAIGMAIVVSLGLLARSGQANLKLVALLGGVSVLVFAFLAVHGKDKVSHRLDDFFAGNIEALDATGGRRQIWAANVDGIRDYPLLGAGVGSHREVYPIYMEEPFHGEFTHAENGYLQVALETGFVGLALMAVGIAICLYWCFAIARSGADSRLVACGAAITGSIVASLVHSLADFVWYIPGLTAVLTVLVACACRSWQLARASNSESPRGLGWELPRFAWIGATCLMLALSGWMMKCSVGAMIAEKHWFDYLRIALHENRDDNEEDSKADPAEMTVALQATVKQQPDHARAHLRLARMYLLQFAAMQRHAENPMSLEQIRDAAVASQFSSREALDEWLERAIGKHRRYLDGALLHTRRALELCPLQGSGYLYLARLCFLEGADEQAKNEYLAQAVKVRPHDGRILFAVGREAFLAGDLSRAMEFWRQSFGRSRQDKQRVIELLAGQIPVQAFPELFELDTEALGLLVDRYRELQRSQEIGFLITRYADALEADVEQLAPTEAAKSWLKIHHLRLESGDAPRAARCLGQALKCDASNFDVRHRAGVWLYEHGDYANAAKHLTWCAQRRPENVKLREMAAIARREAPQVGEAAGESSTRR